MKISGAARRKPPFHVKPSMSAQHEWLCGTHAVTEALRAGRRRCYRLWLRESLHPARAEVLSRAAEERGVPVSQVSADVLQEKVGEDAYHQGVALEAGPIATVSLGELCERLPVGERCLIILDGVEDPQNLGAILRVGEAAGVSGVVLGERHSPPLGASVARASAGALEYLPIARVTNLSRSFKDLKKKGFWILGADPEGAEDLYSAPDRVFEGDLVWVFGAEGRGLRPGVQSLLDHRIQIPLAGWIASLNVANAAAVVLFETRRRRKR